MSDLQDEHSGDHTSGVPELTRKRTFRDVRDLSTRLEAADTMTHIKEITKKIKASVPGDLRESMLNLCGLHAEIAVFGELMHTCRVLQNQVIHAAEKLATRDARARIEDFVAHWETPGAKLWDSSGRPLRIGAGASGFEAQTHLLSFRWEHDGFERRLQTRFLTSPGIRLAYRTSMDRRYLVAVRMFNRGQQRHNYVDGVIFPHGVRLIRLDHTGFGAHVITEGLRKKLFARAGGHLRTVSKTFLHDFSAFPHVVASIAHFCRDPWCLTRRPYIFKAKYMSDT